MQKEERTQIIHGRVCSNGNWISIEKKAELEKQRQQKIRDGYVKFQGEWITIEEKLRRVHPKPEQPEIPQQVVINNYDNRRVYNVHHHHDNSNQQTIHEHKHLHLSESELREISVPPDGRLEAGAEPIPLDDGDKIKALPKNKKPRFFPGGKKGGDLPPPESDS